MASLYIKDPETAALAARVATRLCTTTTEAVRNALRKVEAELSVQPKREQSTLEWLREYREKHPLGPRSDVTIDKAFFDELWGEEPD